MRQCAVRHRIRSGVTLADSEAVHIRGIERHAAANGGMDHRIPIFQLVGRTGEPIAEKEHRLLKRQRPELPDQAFQRIDLAQAIDGLRTSCRAAIRADRWHSPCRPCRRPSCVLKPFSIAAEPKFIADMLKPFHTAAEFRFITGS